MFNLALVEWVLGRCSAQEMLCAREEKWLLHQCNWRATRNWDKEILKKMWRAVPELPGERFWRTKHLGVHRTCREKEAPGQVLPYLFIYNPFWWEKDTY